MGYWIASVPSKNYKKTSHAIIMNNTAIYHDPSTKKKYRTGRKLLGTSIVKGGWFLEIIDSSKLEKLIELRNNKQTKKKKCIN